MSIRLGPDVRRILDILEEAPQSMGTLVEGLDLPQPAVAAGIERLRGVGFQIGAHREDYVLDGTAEYPACIARGLRAPFSLELHDTIESTNDRARELGRRGDDDIAIIANRQTGGEGRHDRVWHSPPGGIWCTVLVRPELPSEWWALYTLAGAIAVVNAVPTTGVPLQIKWPNDVLIGKAQRKLAGILTKSGRSTSGDPWVAVGIGMNADVDPTQLPTGAASLREVSDSVDRCQIGRRLLDHFDALRDRPDVIRDRWRHESDTLGRQVRVETPRGPVSGLAKDIEETGALVIETEIGTSVVSVGDCDHLDSA